MPLRNAFVPIPDIIQIPEKSSSDSCTKYATHIAPLLVRDAACGGQLCTHSGQRNDWKCAPRCSAHLQRKEYFYFAFVALCGVLQTHFSPERLRPGATFTHFTVLALSVFASQIQLSQRESQEHCRKGHNKKHRTFLCSAFLSGGDYRDRTGDLLHAMQALSQLS